MSASAFPLQWPAGRPRKPAALRARARFNKKEYNGRWNETKSLTVADAAPCSAASALRRIPIGAATRRSSGAIRGVPG